MQWGTCVSCSTSIYEPLLFKELINIYDHLAWMCLIFTMVGLTVGIGRMRQRWSFVANAMAIFKVIVGQGDPFLHKVLKSVPIRLMAVAFLFMGIVISEGYKSTNMHNTVTPRKVVSKENVSELVNDKFTIYTRSSHLMFHFNDRLSNPENVSYDVFNNSISSDTAFIDSEVEASGYGMSSLSASRLHPQLVTVMKDLITWRK